MSNRRSALGRGLGALIPGAGQAAERQTSGSSVDTVSETTRSEQTPDSGPKEGAPSLLPVSEIDANPDQPRRTFDPRHLAELSRSIERHGVLQPIVVRRAGSRYEMIVGERRLRATQLAGLKTIPAVVADIETRARLELAIIENVQRHDLNPIELAYAYRALAESGATQDEIGEKVSKDRSSIANHLRLLELGRDLQEHVEAGRLSMGHAKALLQVSNPERRHHLATRVIDEKLSVRDAELLGREIAGPAKNRPAAKARKPRKSSGLLDPNLAPVVEDLQRRLQTRVRIVGGKERGKIEIEYFEAEDLDRVVGLLMGEARM